MSAIRPAHPYCVELVLALGMVVDANELAVRYTRLEISRDAGQHAGDPVRPPGRPDAARTDKHPLAGFAPVTCQGPDMSRAVRGARRAAPRPAHDTLSARRSASRTT
jgi:hypothetical protein